MSENLDELLEELSEAPNSQISSEIVPRLRDLIGKSEKDIAISLRKILDECAYYSLASDFAMQAMGETYRLARDHE